MLQAQVPLGSLPITLVLLSNGQVVLVPMGKFGGVVENGEGVLADFYDNGFLIRENDVKEEYFYRQTYLLDSYPLLKRWIQKQNLPSPF